MREKLIDTKLRAAVKRAGGMYIKLCTTYIAGLPDRLILLPGGRVVFAELKTTGKKPAPIQKLIINKLIGLGFTVFVVDSEDTLADLLLTF